MSSSNSPCGACKLQRQKCTPDCIFAPYFPADQMHKFLNIHTVFGTSNVQKLLSKLPSYDREEATTCLGYEADARLKDPIYGCLGEISMLQRDLNSIVNELENAKNELAKFIGPTTFTSIVPAAVPDEYMPSQPYNMPMMGMQSQRVIGDLPQQEQQFLQQQQEMHEAQLLAMEMEQQQDMQRQYLQEDLVNFDGGLNGSSIVTATGINQITSGNVNSPSLDLGNFQNLNIKG